jgi:hypothetical protein
MHAVYALVLSHVAYAVSSLDYRPWLPNVIFFI